MPSQREYKSFPKQIWSFCFSSFTDCRKIYKYNIGLSIYLKFSYFTNKSYFYHFIVINFAKPSWRSLRTMISSVTNPTDFVDCSDTIHKMWSCSFWTLPQKVVVIIVRPTISVRKSPRKNLPPRNTPDSFCRRFTRQNPSLCCMGGIFLYGSCSLKISWADRTWYRFSVNAAAKQGQELRSEQTAINIHEQRNSLLIFAS